jgi:hypothetical protein
MEVHVWLIGILLLTVVEDSARVIATGFRNVYINGTL